MTIPRMNLLSSQVVPSNPASHVQVKSAMPSAQFPLTHGLGLQSSMSKCIQYSSMNRLMSVMLCNLVFAYPTAILYTVFIVWFRAHIHVHVKMNVIPTSHV